MSGACYSDWIYLRYLGRGRSWHTATRTEHHLSECGTWETPTPCALAVHASLVTRTPLCLVPQLLDTRICPTALPSPEGGLSFSPVCLRTQPTLFFNKNHFLNDRRFCGRSLASRVDSIALSIQAHLFQLASPPRLPFITPEASTCPRKGHLTPGGPCQPSSELTLGATMHWLLLQPRGYELRDIVYRKLKTSWTQLGWRAV